MRKSRLASAAVAAVLVGAFGFSVPAFAAGHGAVSVVEKDGKVTIGNDAISRTFSASANGKLETEEIFNKRANKKFDPSDKSEEFIVKLTKKNDAAGGLNTGDWTIVSQSSEETTGDGPSHGYAKNFIDGDTNTFWHTKYTGNKDAYPHHVVIDLKKSTSFQCFSYTPRAQGAEVNGNVKGYKLYVSNAEQAPSSDEGWGEPVAQGDFTYDGVNPIYVNLDQQATGRWVKFVAVSPNNNREDGKTFAGGAEFNLFSSKHTAKPSNDRDFAASELVLDDADPVTITSTTAEFGGESRNGQVVSFNFEPFEFNGVTYNVTENVVMFDGDHYMRKFLDISVPSDQASMAAIDYIDLEFMKVDGVAKEDKWTIPTGKGGIVQMEEFKANLGQPIYVEGMFFGCEFPVADSQIEQETGRIRYYSGKDFNRLLADEQAVKAEDGSIHYSTWQTVAGAARSTDTSVVQSDFFDYIDDISTPSEFRIQYNSWFDNMMNIDNKNILDSFKEIDRELVQQGVRPLDSYVVDDGWNNYNDTDQSVDVSKSGTGKNTKGFWDFNSKFPDGFTSSSQLVRDLGSDFGAWIGPRGGYNFFGNLGKILQASGKGSLAGGSVDVADRTYVSEFEKMVVGWQDEYRVNYWKWDGFADGAQYGQWSATDGVPGRANNHMTGGAHNMYHVTDLWEAWIDLFEGVRTSEAELGLNKLWISLTCYVNPSPWYLQWANSVWLQCGPDQAGAGESTSQMDRQLVARDAAYYDYLKGHEFQFPLANIYNHDPVYGQSGTGMSANTATAEQFQNYLYMLSARGTAFWELYYSDSLLDNEKYEVTAEFLKWAEENNHILRNAKIFGGTPATGVKLETGPSKTSPTVEVSSKAPYNTYGFSAFDGSEGIITMRNPDWKKAQQITFTFDEALGVPMEKGASYAYHIEHAYKHDEAQDKISQTGTFVYGKEYSFTLQPEEVVMFRISKAADKNAPSVSVVDVEGANGLVVRFDEKVMGDAKFTVNGADAKPVKKSADDVTFHLELAAAPKDGEKLSVKVEGLTDMAGNASKKSEGTVVYHEDGTVASRVATELAGNQLVVSSAGASFTGRDGLTVSSLVNTSGAGAIVSQSDQYKLGVDAEGHAYFTLNGVTATSRVSVADGSDHSVTGVKENNGIVKIYVDGELQGSAYDKKNATYEVKAGSIVLGGEGFTGTASARVFDRAYGYDKVAELKESDIPNTEVRNLAAGKAPSAHMADGSTAHVNSDMPMSNATDGRKDTDHYAEFGTDQDGSGYLEFDLGGVFDLDQVKMWRYFKDSRQYKNTVIAVSKTADFKNPVVVFNADKENVFKFGAGDQDLYTETQDGKAFDVPEGTLSRYVRVYMNGSSTGKTNHVVELEVMGKSPSLEQNRIDTAELDKRIAELDALIASGNYTDESAAKVSTIVDAARKVANNPESEKAVSDALKTLEKIEDQLETRPVAPAPDQGEDKVTVEKHPDGSQTVTTTTKDGTSTKVDVDAKGNVTAVDATVSKDAAKDGSVTLPMDALEQTSSKKAPVISVKVPASVNKDSQLVVTIPVAKDKGDKTVDPGLVVIMVDKDGKETVLPKTAVGADGVTVAIDGNCDLKVVDNAKKMSDVSASDWFAEGVVPFATARGIVNGVELADGTRVFDGYGKTSRGMFVAMLHNLELNPKAATEDSLADVPADAFYAGAAAWAVENGLLSGVDMPDGSKQFQGNADVTREQVAVFLMRYAQSLGMDVSARAKVDFPDADELSDFAKDAMSWAVAEGLFTGDDTTGELNPTDGAARAEVAAVLMRFINQMYA